MSLNFCASAALCLALVGSAAASAPAAPAAPAAPRAFAAAPRNLDGYSFEAYEAEFSKRYASAAERAAHEATFAANLLKVRAWNQAFAAGNQTWFAAVNPFTDLTSEQMKPRRGLSKAQRLAARRARLDAAAAPLLEVRAEDLPVNVDWRDKGVVTDVKDQGQV